MHHYQIIENIESHSVGLDPTVSMVSDSIHISGKGGLNLHVRMPNLPVTNHLADDSNNQGNNILAAIPKPTCLEYQLFEIQNGGRFRAVPLTSITLYEGNPDHRNYL